MSTHSLAPSLKRRPIGPFSMRSVVLPACLGTSLLAGLAIAHDGFAKTAALGLAAIVIAGILIAVKAPEGALFVEIPVALLLLSNQVIRVRNADALEANPLDSAAQFRVVGILLALALGILAMISERGTPVERGLPFKLYSTYVFVVFLGVLMSADPMLTTYRGFELAASLCVLIGATRYMGPEAIPRIMKTLFWFAVVLVVSVWLGMVHSPDMAMRGLKWSGSPLSWQIQGALPVMAPNTVGLYATIVTLWSMANLVSVVEIPRLKRSLALALTAIGMLTLVLSQYRTGYIAFALGVLILAITRGKKMMAFLCLAVVVFVAMSGPSLSEETQPFLLRGQSVEEAQELSGRLDWWSLAIPVWKESPLIGKGLLTASRFEVLAANGYKTASTIHGTWIEALVGTGVIGVLLLATTFLTNVGRALRSAFRREGAVVPIVLLIAIGTRSATGATFEAFQYVSVLFAALCLWLAHEARKPERSPFTSAT